MKQVLKDKLALADKIDEAADAHVNKGWCRSAFFDGNKKACATGHLLNVYGISKEKFEEDEEINMFPQITDATKEIAKDLVGNGRVPITDLQSAYDKSSADDFLKKRSVDFVITFNDNYAESNQDVAASFRFTSNRLRTEVFKTLSDNRKEKQRLKDEAAEAAYLAERQAAGLPAVSSPW